MKKNLKSYSAWLDTHAQEFWPQNRFQACILLRMESSYADGTACDDINAGFKKLTRKMEVPLPISPSFDSWARICIGTSTLRKLWQDP